MAVAASASWRLRSVVSAVARMSPFLTVAPTVVFTSVTVQVVEPLAAAVAPARWAGEPKAVPYDALAATLPVAATSSVTSPVATVPVRYWVVAAALVGRPPAATTTAPMPTRARPTMARILSFMTSPGAG